jgi:DNA polymerase
MKKHPLCAQCKYFRQPFVKSEGPYDAEVVFIGDSPWYHEAREGRPFVGPAGQMLDDLIMQMGIERSAVFLTNTIHCQPFQLGETHPKEAVELCRQLYLLPELSRMQPKLIVPMGNVAIKCLGERANIGSVRGAVKDVTIGDTDYKMLPTYHPSFLNRKPAYKPYADMDFRTIDYYLQHGHEPELNTDLDYRSVVRPEEIDVFFEQFKNAKMIAWDVETTGLDFRSDSILSMQWSFAPKTGYCMPFYLLPYAPPKEWPVDPMTQKFFDTLDPSTVHGPTTWLPTANKEVTHKIYDLLHDTSKVYFFHNGKFDLRMMDRFFRDTLGLPIQINHIRWYDTMAMYGLLDENTSQKLKDISRLYTDLRYSAADVADVKGGQMKKMDLYRMTRYGIMDCDSCRRLAILFGKTLRELGLWPIFAEHDGSDKHIAQTLYKMETFGAPIDHVELLIMKNLLREKLDAFHQTMEHWVGHAFNPNSCEQLAAVLFEELHYPIPDKRTPGGAISTDKEVIDALIDDHPHDPFLTAFRHHRNYSSIDRTFVRGLEARLWPDGRLRPDFRFTNVVSGRVVCTNPNLANIPREKEYEDGVIVSVRSFFAAKPGKKIGYGDFSQQEFKVMAILSNDKRLIHALFVEYQDFHTLVARALYPGYTDREAQLAMCTKELVSLDPETRPSPQLIKEIASCQVFLTEARTKAKAFNFARNYLAKDEKLAATLSVSVADVQHYTGLLAEEYPAFEKFVRDEPAVAIERGYCLNRYGRYRRFPYTSDTRVREGQSRQAGNFGPQSNSAYVGRTCLVRIANAFERVGMHAYPFNVVYDSILLEMPDDEIADAMEIMCRTMIAPVPELDNHVFSIEAGVGQSWKEAETHKAKIRTPEDIHSALAIFTEK